MTTLVRTSWVTQVLRLVPSRVLAALDAWSYSVALKRAEQRRIAANRKPSPVAAPQYNLKIWSE